MADKASEGLKNLDKAIADAESFHKEGTQVLKDLAKLKSDVGNVRSGGPDIKKLGWLKMAEAAGADKKILASLKAAESSGSRDSCVAVLQLVKGDKNLKKVADGIQAELDRDEKLAKELTKVLAEIKAMGGQVSKLEGETKSLPATMDARLKDTLTMIKLIQGAKAKKG